MNRFASFTLSAVAISVLFCIPRVVSAESDDVTTGSAPSDTEEVALDRGPLAQLSARLAYNSDFGPVVGARVATNRLADGTQSLSFSFEASEDRLSYSFFYAAPEVFGSNPAFGLAVSAAQSEAADAFQFDSTSVSIEPRLTWRLDETSRIAAYLQFAYAEIEGVYPATSNLIRNDEGAQQSQVLGLEYNRSLSYETGALRRLTYRGSFEIGETDRDNRFTEISGRASAAWRIGADDNIQLQAQLRGGAINSMSGVTNIGDRTFLSSSSLRGFEFGGFGPHDTALAGTPALGGNMYTVARFDAQFDDLFGSDRVVPGVFLDVGSLWGLDDTAGGVAGTDLVDDGLNLRASIGLTLEIDTNLGPIGISIAHPFEREAYDRTQEFSLTFQRSF
jgi:outer membrane protein insertion porin family